MENTGEIGDVEDVEFREVLSVSSRPAARPWNAAAGAKARLRRPQREQSEGRHIRLQHLAFFRGYLEGLDLAELGEQYLEFGRDPREAAGTRQWLVTAFVAAARKRQDFATARLLAIPASGPCHASPRSGRPPQQHPRWRTSPPGTTRIASIPKRNCSSFSPRITRTKVQTPRPRCAASSATRACASGRWRRLTPSPASSSKIQDGSIMCSAGSIQPPHCACRTS
jgi:hypothetical protein